MEVSAKLYSVCFLAGTAEPDYNQRSSAWFSMVHLGCFVNFVCGQVKKLIERKLLLVFDEIKVNELLFLYFLFVLGKELAVLDHESAVTSVLQHPQNENLYLTGSMDLIQLWDRRTSSHVREFVYNRRTGQVCLKSTHFFFIMYVDVHLCVTCIV